MYKNPEATKNAIKDGWVHSGDLGKMDDEGYITLVDRKKDMIITGGENVYSKEVEDAIFENPKVADAVIIGMPHPTWGETVTAVVVTRPNETLTLDELREFLTDKACGLQDPAETGSHRSPAAQRCRQGPQVPAQGPVQGKGGQIAGPGVL